MKTMRRKKSPVRGTPGGKGAGGTGPRRKGPRTAEAPEAEGAGERRGFLLSQLSHDLRNPLTVVLWNAQGLRRHLPADHAGRRYLDAIERGADEMAQMLDELSDAARIDDGRLGRELKLEPVRLPELVEEALAAVRAQAESRQITVTARISPDVAPFACDRARMGRILASLIRGGARATPKQGAMTVELTPDGAGGARFVVTDGGPPLAADELTSLFALPTGIRKRSILHGSAITLYVVRHVVEAHGGAIAAEAVEGQGTRFVVTLPGRSSA